MSLGADIAAALPELRAQAESMMVDTCEITRPGAGNGQFNETTGQYDPPAPVTVYQGRCRVQVPNVAENAADAGERAYTVQSALVQLPVVGSEGIHPGDTVTILTAALDVELVGCRYTVTAAHHKTHATARRLRCKEVTS